MARKRAPKVPATKEVKTEHPVRFMMPDDLYRRLERQAESLGVSRAIYARMKVIQGIKADEKESEK